MYVSSLFGCVERHTFRLNCTCQWSTLVSRIIPGSKHDIMIIIKGSYAKGHHDSFTTFMLRIDIRMPGQHCTCTGTLLIRHGMLMQYQMWHAIPLVPILNYLPSKNRCRNRACCLRKSKCKVKCECRVRDMKGFWREMGMGCCMRGHPGMRMWHDNHMKGLELP